MTAKPYDPTVKVLVEVEPESWPPLVGGRTGPTEVIDADIATISGAADKVLRVSTEPPYLLHLEFVTGHDTAVLPRKLHVRNCLLEDRHDQPVRSAAVLLNPGSDSPQLTGVYERALPDDEAYLTFRYQVVRVWRLPSERLLTGGLGLLPLAPISAVTEGELPGIIKRMGQRLRSRPARQQAQTLWGAAYILLGLRYSPALAAQLFRGVVSMKESSTYQAILEEGRTEGRIEGRTEGRIEGRTEGRIEGRTEGAVAEARKLFRVAGDSLFGPPDPQTATAIEGIEDLTRLEELFARLQTVSSWQELLGPSAAGPRTRRRRKSP